MVNDHAIPLYKWKMRQNVLTALCVRPCLHPTVKLTALLGIGNVADVI